MLEGEDDVEDSQELRDLCHFFDFIEGEVASSRNFEFTQVCRVFWSTVAFYCKSAIKTLMFMPGLSVHTGFCELKSRSRSSKVAAGPDPSLKTVSAE